MLACRSSLRRELASVSLGGGPGAGLALSLGFCCCACLCTAAGSSLSGCKLAARRSVLRWLILTWAPAAGSWQLLARLSLGRRLAVAGVAWEELLLAAASATLLASS